MPIGTSDGQYFETEFDQAVAENKQRLGPVLSSWQDQAGPNGVPRIEITPRQQPTTEEPVLPTADGQIQPQTNTKIEPDWGKGVSRFMDNLVKSATDAATAPGRAYKGEIPPDKMVDEGLNLAGWVTGSGSVVPKPAGSIGLFGSSGAKTFSQENFLKAIEMYDKKIADDVIFKETGMFSGADGIVRFEIPDTNAKLTGMLDYLSNFMEKHKDDPVAKGSASLGSLYDHPELYKAYPDAKNILIEFDNSLGHILGAMNGAEHRMKLNPRLLKNLDELKSVVTHELQHWIQQKEGLNKGGVPADLSQIPLPFKHEVEKIQKEWDKYANIISDIIQKDPKAKERFELANKPGWHKVEGAKPDMSSILTEPRMRERFIYLEKVLDTYDRLKAAAVQVAFENYQKLAGEVEARNVQNRLNPLLKEIYPPRTETVGVQGTPLSYIPRDQQKVYKQPKLMGPKGPIE